MITINKFLDTYHYWHQAVILSSIVIALTIPFIVLSKKLIDFLSDKFDIKYGSNYSRLARKHNINRYLFHSSLVLYISLCINFLNIDQILSPHAINIKRILIFIYGSFSFSGLLLGVINIFADAYKEYFLSKHFPIHLPIQILKILIISWLIIIVVSQILHISPTSIVTSLGAATAFLTFVFKDAISGLIASLQLILQNKIQIGDRVNIPQYNIKGDIETISITEIRIRTNIGSIVTIPPYHLLTANITNWRDIKKNKPRSINRTIFIDINSIVFCSQDFIDSFNQSPNLLGKMKSYLNQIDIDTENNVTNLELFKIYSNKFLEEYLEKCEQVVDYSVYESESSPLGIISLEIDINLKRTEWRKYEAMNSSIFFHLVAMLPKFKIKIASK